MTEPVVIARTPAGAEVVFRPGLANRHGLIAGATGTGKTVTLQLLAENLSRLGVPVFLADIKSDLSGLAAAGSSSSKMRDRLAAIGIREPKWNAAPVVFWDVFGRRGYPVRATISDVFSKILLGSTGPRGGRREGLLEAAARSAARSVGSGFGRAIIRGTLGSILGGGRSRR